jgi:hypothetical protein
VIEVLKARHRVLGWALEALIELDGEVPREPDVEFGEDELARAWAILEAAEDDKRIDRAPIASLLRYAVFTVMKARLMLGGKCSNPAYDKRLELIREILDTPYMKDPIWLFDYGMLCYQNGEYAAGADAFRELRRGQKFFSVSNDRSVVLTESPQTTTPRQLRIQVQSLDRVTGQGWGRIIDRKPFRDPVPFSMRSFESRDEQVRERGTLPCIVTVRPAGPYAEPVPRR